MLLHDWLDEDFKESVNEEVILRICFYEQRVKNTAAICEGGRTDAPLLERSVTFWTFPHMN